MEEIIHAFGIDWRLIVIQMFNFAVLAGALWYFLYTPVLTILSDREAKLKKGVEDVPQAVVFGSFYCNDNFFNMVFLNDGGQIRQGA